MYAFDPSLGLEWSFVSFFFVFCWCTIQRVAITLPYGMSHPTQIFLVSGFVFVSELDRVVFFLFEQRFSPMALHE